jgi:plasmid stability protein
MCQHEWMPIMIQVRNVPERLHRELKRRAKLHGQTLTDYIQGILEREVAKPDRRDVLARILKSPPVDLKGMTGADLVHEARREAGRE